MVQGKLYSYVEKNEIRIVSNTRYKNKSKLIKDLHVRPDIIKLLEENIGRILFVINCSSIFFFLAPKVRK